jgi:hypothetical protein
MKDGLCIKISQKMCPHSSPSERGWGEVKPGKSLGSPGNHIILNTKTYAQKLFQNCLEKFDEE